MSQNIFITGTSTEAVVLNSDDSLAVLKGGTLDVEGTAVQGAADAEDVSIFVAQGGTIDGTVNAVEFGNGGQSSGRLINLGTIRSDSRAVNIGGSDILLLNLGTILGTGNQRNGTVYADATAADYRIINGGTIDAGASNQGAAISLETGDSVGEGVRAHLSNTGTIQGRGQATASSPLAGDGIRLYSGLETGGTFFRGDIFNRGAIRSESTQGTTAGIRVVDGLGFRGQITNAPAGEISGAQNGVYFGDAAHDATVINQGTISSNSRAINIDGTDVDIINHGQVLGTGNQRNGTIYADGTANDYRITNGRLGVVDAGVGNQGAGVSFEVGVAVGDRVQSDLFNRGTIQGRGQALATSTLAGDGIRLVSGVPPSGAAVYGSGSFYQGDIVNSGNILSESSQGTTGGIRAADGLGFEGTITNTRSGLVAGVQNGIYFGDAKHQATVRNFGRISSNSRAINIDGTGVDIINNGQILGAGNQRNGTIYADGTANDYRITNARLGVIDAGEGNQGAGISLETGVVAGDIVQAQLVNAGRIQGRGTADPNTNLAGDGIRIFAGVSAGQITFEGDITNRGDILGSDDGVDIQTRILLNGNIDNQGTIIGTDAGLEILGTLAGTINNRGTIQGSQAIDATFAEAAVRVNNRGLLDGEVSLSAFNDILDSRFGQLNGPVFGNDGNDTLYGSAAADTLVGGEGDDLLKGGAGADVFGFTPFDTGADIVSDFQNGVDLLDVSAFNFGAADLQAVITGAQQLGLNTLLTLAAGNTVTLQNVQVDSISANDFITV